MSSNVLYQQIREYLINLIENNRDKANYQLPSENQLCLKFHASRVSVQHAFRLMEEEGLIYRQQGRGTFARSQSEQPSKINTTNNLIGMLVPTYASTFVQDIICSIQEELLKHELTLATFSTNDSTRMENSLINTVHSIGAKGLITIPVSFNRYSDEMLRLALNRFPTVQIDRYLPGLPNSFVTCDHYRSAYNITTMFQSQGHKKIGFVSQPLEYCNSVSTRYSGYEHAMQDAGILYNDQVRFDLDICDPNYEEAFSTYLNTIKPTALILASRYYGVHIAKVFAKHNIQMMKDIDIAVYDTEFEDVLAYTDLMPIIIDQQPREIGKCAVNELMRLINGKKSVGQIFVPEVIKPSCPNIYVSHPPIHYPDSSDSYMSDNTML